MKKMISFKVLFLSLLISVSSFAQLQEVTQDIKRPRGPIDDCLQSAYLYSEFDGIESECTLNYVHFRNTKNIRLSKKPGGKIQIGSFNVYHLGDEQAIMKNYESLALIINQWDVVAVQEIMPLPGQWAQHNDALATLVHDQTPLTATVVEPGYYRLLKRLRNLDSSWSLILQPLPEGSGVSGEMAGFYYRAKHVQLKEWHYCDEGNTFDLKRNIKRKNSACSVRVNEQKKKLMSRNGFVANFRSIGFDFVGISFHARFRNIESSRLPIAVDEICQNITDEKCRKMPADEIGRFVEVKLIADEIPYMQQYAKDNDVIFMGDFNIEILEKNQLQWQASLQNATGYKPFQTRPTTLSLTKENLASNYDHFIFNPELTQQCDINSIKSFDFTQPELDLKNPVNANLLSLNLQESHDRILSHNLSLLQNVTLSQKIRGEDRYEMRRMNDKEKLELTRKFNERSNKMRKSPFANYFESISDHLPISMSCSTTK